MMRLTKFTDYSVRVLVYAALHSDRLVTIEETAAVNAISRAHVKKIVVTLTQLGHLRGQRGRGGGFTLGRKPAEINLGVLIRQTEPDLALVDCVGSRAACQMVAHCRLPVLLNRALGGFFRVLDAHTLDDVVTGRVSP